jgi:hypothetical protein
MIRQPLLFSFRWVFYESIPSIDVYFRDIKFIKLEHIIVTGQSLGGVTDLIENILVRRYRG